MMDRRNESLDALDLYDHPVLDDQVGTVLSDELALVVHRNSHLSLNGRDSWLRELDAQRRFVVGLEEARAEMSDEPRCAQPMMRLVS